MIKWKNAKPELEGKIYQNFYYDGENIIGIVTPKQRWKIDSDYMLTYLKNKIEKMNSNPCANMFRDKIDKNEKMLKQLNRAVKKAG